MLRSLLPLALAGALLCPIAASAQAPAPTPPAVPAAPVTPAAPVPAKKHDRVNGKISTVDAAARTITVVTKKKTTVLTLTPDAKIFKIGDKRKATGAFSDLLIDTPVSAHVVDPDAATLMANEVHIRKPKAPKP